MVVKATYNKWMIQISSKFVLKANGSFARK